MDSKKIDWSKMYRERLKIREEYRSVWKIPITKKYKERIKANIDGDKKILEVGAGSRELADFVYKISPDSLYKSMDIDKTNRHDYYNLDEIKEKFDLIIMIEVIEHLTLEEGLVLLKRLKGLLNDNGTILLTTPNLYHPHRYFDAMHITPYKYDEIGAILRLARFNNIKLFRIYNNAFHRKVLRRYVGILLHRYLDIDFATTILVEAKR